MLNRVRLEIAGRELSDIFFVSSVCSIVTHSVVGFTSAGKRSQHPVRFQSASRYHPVDCMNVCVFSGCIDGLTRYVLVRM